MRHVIFITIVILAALAAVSPCYAQPDDLIEVTGWRYHYGDSPRNDKGHMEWLDDDGSSWGLVPGKRYPPGHEGQVWIWYKATLPNTEVRGGELFLNSVFKVFEVFVGDELVYTSGNMDTGRKRYADVIRYFVPLPKGYAGKTISLRVRSDEPGMVGISSFDLPIAVGTERAIMRRLFMEGVETAIIGTFIAIIGLIALLLNILRVRQHSRLLLWLGLLCVWIGPFYLSLSTMTEFIVKSPIVRHYVSFGTYAIFPIFFYLFLGQIVRPKRIATILWSVHLVWAVIALLADVLHLYPSSTLGIAHSIVFVITISTAIVASFLSALRGNHEARIFLFGVGVTALTGLNDILIGVGAIPYWHWVSPWGTLVLIFSLVYLSERRFALNQRLLQSYSQELEEKSEQLHEYATTLEQKVTERTADLNQANNELRTAMTELKDAQAQLILKEKLASLGSLVAGVAHEVNNPIGALNSAADVSKRCIDILDKTVRSPEQTRVCKALDTLTESNAIISDAGNRVARIVRSLKNFSRLDESDFQRADLHEGLDSTLTLLHHQIKNRVEVVKNYGDIPEIECFPNELNQVFMNLLVNAAQAIDDTGTITITTRYDGDDVIVAINDTGRGIDAKHVGRVFDPGFTTKGVGVGTGLGLSISYRIVQKHDGTITVDSEPGKGTTFTIRLPVNRVRG